MIRILTRRWFWIALLLFVVCALTRISLLKRQSIWADEAFSLAMASGHSMEHPADQADASQGDYIEPHDVGTRADYRKYLTHDSPPASPARVIRAVFMSDTSPPLYYLLLYAWTRILGTGDSSLRLFTVMAALACFPLVWWIARRIGGTRAAIFACLLITLSPIAIYYGTEGRMYSLLWFFTLATMASALQLWRRGSSFNLLALFIVSAACGLMTHYFFAFVLAAIGMWLMIFPGRSSRGRIILAAVVIGALVSPWYIRIPTSLHQWRVTDYWLNLVPRDFSRPIDILCLPWSFFTIAGVWDYPRDFDKIAACVFVAFVLLALALLNRRLFTPKRLLLWLCIVAPFAGLVVFDFWRKTFVVDCPRYALAGFPAAILLAGFALARFPKLLGYAFVAMIVFISLIGDRRIYNSRLRINPTELIAWELDNNTTPDDVIIVSSIPSGVSAIARYMQPKSADEPGFVSWVGQLKQRKVPDDLLRFSHGRKRIVLVRMHEVVWPSDHEDWLMQHAKRTQDIKLQAGEIEFFSPQIGERF